MRNKTFDTLTNYVLEMFPYVFYAAPLFAHVGNLFRTKVCSPNTFVLWYAGTKSQNLFLPIPRLIAPRNGH
jgi:hypothetical protein